MNDTRSYSHQILYYSCTIPYGCMHVLLFIYDFKNAQPVFLSERLFLRLVVCFLFFVCVCLILRNNFAWNFINGFHTHTQTTHEQPS